MITGFCVLGVVFFYLVICWQGRSNRPSSTELRAKKALRAKRRKEEMAKKEADNAQRRIEAKEAAVIKSRNSARLKQRNIEKEDDSGSANSEHE